MQNNDYFEKLNTTLEEYLAVRTNYFKILVAEKTSKAVSQTVLYMALFFVGFMLVFFISFMFGFYLTEVFHSYIYGFGLVCIVYAFLFVSCFFLFKNKITTKISDSIIDVMLND